MKQTRWRRGRQRAALVLVGLIGTASCAAKPVVRPDSPALASAVSAEATVLLLEPQVRLESPARAAFRIDPTEYDTAGLAAAMSAAASQAAPAARPCEDLAAAEAQPCSLLAARAEKLARGIVEPDSRTSLEQLSRSAAATVLVATSLTGRSASMGRLNPYSGEISSDNASTLLRAAAISCGSGDVVWRNEVLLRELPEPSDDSYAEALQFLFGGAPRLETKSP